MLVIEHHRTCQTGWNIAITIICGNLTQTNGTDLLPITLPRRAAHSVCTQCKRLMECRFRVGYSETRVEVTKLILLLWYIPEDLIVLEEQPVVRELVKSDTRLLQRCVLAGC